MQCADASRWIAPVSSVRSATACVMCPINSYTVRTGATSRSDCVCDSDFYDANATTDIDWALLANLNEVKNDPRNIGNAIVQARVNRYLAIVSRNTSAAVINCQVCPYGTNCMQGETLEALPLVRGFFRVGDDSTDVRKCPDADANCSVTFGTEACVSASGCIGGTDATALCASGLSGTFCRTCINDQAELLSFYVKADEIQEAHCRECGNNLAMSAFMAIVVLCGFGVAAALLVRLKRKPSFAYVMATFTPDNKLKNLIGFYMVATKIDVIYDVALPADVRAVLRSLSTVFTFGLQGFATTPLACLGLGGYVAELLFWIIFPMLVVLVVFSVVLLSIALRRKPRAHVGIQPSAQLKRHQTEGHMGTQTPMASSQAEPTSEPTSEPTVFEKALPPVLQIMFVLYPLVTTAAFEGFPCYEFESGRGWLIADVSIECRTPDHASAQTLAWTAVLIYPVGLWLLTLLLLTRARKAIVSGIETPLSRACFFLYKEYDVTCFWWELMEMGRKFLLVGLFVWQPTQGSITQISVGTIVSAVYLMIQLQARPYKHATDDYLASASSFGLLMIFICSIIFKYTSLTDTEDIQGKMSIEQQGDYVVSTVAISIILVASVLGSLVMVAIIAAVQTITEVRKARALRRLKYVKDDKWVECKWLSDPQAFHLFLSHAWPAAQDRMRIVKARFLEALPTCRTFLDVDDLKSGSGTAEVDKSECILVFCTSQYFEKKNSLKELYRAVVQRRPILAMLEPDATQEGGLNQADVEALITNAKLDKFKLRKKWAEWKDEGELLHAAFDHAPDEAEVRAALFATPPVEWNRLPHFQDVTIRLIAQNGILNGTAGDLYLQGEAAMGKIPLPPPLEGREFHLFCSPYNAGAKEFAEELKAAPVFVTTGKQASATLTYTTDVTKLALCDHMLVLLDDRTFTSGEDTAKFVEHIHKAMRAGVHVNCIHEFPSVVGPPRHECEFGLFFGDDWTPTHLTGGPTNLYKEIAFALKGVEWRQPGLVAVASKIAGSVGPHKPIDVNVPESYEPKTGPNTWVGRMAAPVAPLTEAVVEAAPAAEKTRSPIGIVDAAPDATFRSDAGTLNA